MKEVGGIISKIVRELVWTGMKADLRYWGDAVDDQVNREVYGQVRERVYAQNSFW
jgi:hypothetical protein